MTREISQCPFISMNNNPNHVGNSNHTLSIAILNSQSLVNKTATFGAFIDDHNPDIVTVSETWLSPDISTAEIFPSGYNVFRKDRQDGHGGVLLASRTSLTCYELSIDSPTEVVSCKFVLQITHILLISVKH